MHGSRLIISLALVVTLALTAGCSHAKPRHVPDVRGERLDIAEAKLETQGLSYEIHGGGKLGVIDDSNWWVCSQNPQVGRWATKVDLAVAKSCPTPTSAEIPNVVGLNLHDARKELEAKHIEVDVETYDEYYDDGDDDIIIVERNWQVCEQDSSTWAGGRSVELIVDHDC
ncbi:MAG: PASTA domain-containing protein [Gaiellaceae bacterium]